MFHYIFQTMLNLLGFPKHLRNVQVPSQKCTSSKAFEGQSEGGR